MKLKKFLIVELLSLALLLLVSHSHSANILAICFFCGQSNKITWVDLLEELGKRGHTITFVTPVKPTKEMKNVKEIFTLDMGQLLAREEFNTFEAQEKGERVPPRLMLDTVHQICNESYDLPHVKALLNENFDLVMYQPLFNDCVLGLIYRLQAPFVMFTPTYIPPWFVSKIGGHLPSSFNTNFLLDYPNEMNFVQRLVNFGADMWVDFFNKFMYEPKIEKLYREKLGSDIPSINDILANTSLALSNSHFSLAGPSPFLPDLVEVGGIHSRPAKPTPKDLEDFIGKGKDGFIMFSLGSFVKGKFMPEDKRKMILKVFSQLKQQVLWKWDTETMPDLPKNVKLSKWLPQVDLLGHPDIKMFITHCGGGSTEEAIQHGVPLVGIPLQTDQPFNAKNARRHGMIVQLKWTELNEEVFMGAIQEVLNNSTYRENAKKASAIFKDRPMGPFDLGTYWIEYVLRHNGAPHLRSAGRKLNSLQYHSYDVIGTYLAIITVTLYVILIILRFTCRKIFCRSGDNSNDKKVKDRKKKH